jgi:hypothetical protein
MCATPEKGQQVVLADGTERDSTRQHKLVVAVVVGERGQPERPGVEQLCVGAGHPVRRLAQPFTVELDATGREEVRSGALRRFQVDSRPSGCYPQVRARRYRDAGERLGQPRGRLGRIKDQLMSHEAPSSAFRRSAGQCRRR